MTSTNQRRGRETVASSRVRKFGWLSVGAVALAGSAALAWWQVNLPPARLVDPNDSLLVARGQQVYVAQCASCHGKDLEGQPDWRSRLPNGRLPAPPHDATGHTWHHPSELLFSIVKDGIVKNAPPGYESDMPAYAGVLPDNDIRAVLSYIKSRWPEDIQRRHDALDRALRDQRSGRTGIYLTAKAAGRLTAPYPSTKSDRAGVSPAEADHGEGARGSREPS